MLHSSHGLDQLVPLMSAAICKRCISTDTKHDKADTCLQSILFVLCDFQKFKNTCLHKNAVVVQEFTDRLSGGENKHTVTRKKKTKRELIVLCCVLHTLHAECSLNFWKMFHSSFSPTVSKRCSHSHVRSLPRPLCRKLHFSGSFCMMGDQTAV